MGRRASKKRQSRENKGDGAGVILCELKEDSFSDMVMSEQKPEGNEEWAMLLSGGKAVQTAEQEKERKTFKDFEGWNFSGGDYAREEW